MRYCGKCGTALLPGERLLCEGCEADLFDADELGLDPEYDDEHHQHGWGEDDESDQE